jgi:hypothetical protein
MKPDSYFAAVACSTVRLMETQEKNRFIRKVFDILFLIA